MEIKRVRRRRWFGAGSLVVFAILTGALSLLALAYVQQSDRVEALETQNDEILTDHHVIGKAFAKQTRRLAQQSKRLDEALRSSYGQGFRAGQEVTRLPRALRGLARHAASGQAVPRRLPTALGAAPPRINANVDGYALRWQGLALFASRSDSLSVWTRQALDGQVRRATLGGRRVNRLVGPSGVIYAWRTGGSTYALIAVPPLEPAGRVLVASMK
jgi:hypothetical protein